MLNSLSKNQFVKMTKPQDDLVEYGLVMSDNLEDNKYEVLSIGYLNKNNEFLAYPTNVEGIKETLGIEDRIFEEVKETKIRRKMNKWLETNYDDLKH